MLAHVDYHALIGVDSVPMTAEVDIRRGMPVVEIVGLLGGAVREARDRICVAIRSSRPVVTGRPHPDQPVPRPPSRRSAPRSTCRWRSVCSPPRVRSPGTMWWASWCSAS